MELFPADLIHAAERVLNRYRDAGLKLATAESCTGGLIAGCLTEIAGSSDVVERGFVTYSNAAKADLLGVPMELIQDVGAVSEDVARAMAEGAIKGSRADAAVAVTGVAGPGGGSADKPVGLVHFCALTRGGQPVSVHAVFAGSRTEVRLAAVARALMLLEGLLDD